MYRNIKTVVGAFVVMGLCACLAYITQSPVHVPENSAQEITLALEVDACSSTVEGILNLHNKKDLDALIATNKPILIMASGEKCYFCKEMKPLFEKFARKNSANITFAILDSKNFPELNITKLPTFMGYKDGTKIFEKYGEQDNRDFNNFKEQLLEQ